MKIKEYKLYKTAKKTAKENSLEYVDSFETGKRNILFVEKSLIILLFAMVEHYIIHIKFMMNMVVNADM